MAYESAPNDRGGFDRRSFIKRATVVSATTVWAAPTVQSLVAPAFAAGTPRGECGACITGGNQVVSISSSPVLLDGVPIGSVSLGLGPICCPAEGMPTEIQVNAHRTNRPQDDLSWHFTENLVVTCSKDGVDASPPPNTANCPNRFDGTVQDTEGNTLAFTLIDHGEPGQQVDFVSISINGAHTLIATGTIDRGNLQVHESLGRIKRDCTACV